MNNIFKFNNDCIDNLIKFDYQNISKVKFKEKDSLNYLIINRQLLTIIPLIFKKQRLCIKKFRTLEEWQNYIDNEFKNWALKNNINKILIKPDDKPDLIVTINDDINNQIGIELTSVFPFIKYKSGGDSFKIAENKQQTIKQNLIKKILDLNLEEKIPKFKIINNKIVFPSNFNNFKDKKIIEETITQVKDLEQITPIYFYPTYFKCPCGKPEHIETLVGCVVSTAVVANNVKNELSVNNLESNLLHAIEDKNEKLEKYYKLKVETNVLLIIVEEISYFINWFIFVNDNSSDNNSYEIKGEGCINNYLNRIYSNIEKLENNFVQTIIIYKNAESFIEHIYICLNK